VFQEKLGQRMKQRTNFVEPVTVRTRLDRVVFQMNVTEQKTESFPGTNCETQLSGSSVSQRLQRKHGTSR
jgi:hypothetical protein